MAKTQFEANWGQRPRNCKMSCRIGGKDTAITEEAGGKFGPPARSQSSVNLKRLEEGGNTPEVCLESY